MRVLQVNYRYFVSGGPEKYMFAVGDMLRGAGHEVIPFSVRYARNRETPWAPYFADPIGDDDAVYFCDHKRSPRAFARGLQRAFYARDVEAAASRIIAAATPDVALVQHYLRKLSPAVLVALHKAGVPIVVRLSDFAMVCPEAHLLRGGGVCRLCITGGLTQAVRHRCVQGSAGVSTVAAASLWFARRRGYFDLVDTFIAPSTIMRDEMVAGGYDRARIVVLPTFVAPPEGGEAGASADASAAAAPPAAGDAAPPARRIVYIGRLSPEKGVRVLLDAFAQLQHQDGFGDLELHLAGACEGDEAAALVARARGISPRIRFLGELDQAAVRELLAGAAFSVVPSLWYENLPNTMLESLAAGTPVAASDLGSMADVLRGTDAGFLFRPGDAGDLARGLARALREPATLERMSAHASELAATRYAPAAHLAGLTDVLQAAIARGPAGPGRGPSGSRAAAGTRS